MTGFDVSVGISPRQPLQDWSHFAAEVEQEGARRLWLIDSQLAMKDVYAGLLLAAGTTRRLGLGPGVTNPLTRHPTVTASAIAALSELAPGRTFLGIGAGDSAVYGIGMRPATIAMMEATLRFLREVLRGGEADLEGRTYSLPHLAASVPIYVAVSQKRMCELAGRVADGAIVMGPAQPALVERQVEWITSAAAMAGRSRDELDILFMATTSARSDSGAALADVRSWAATQARLLADFKELPPALDPFQGEIRRSKEEYDYRQHLSTHAEHQEAVSDDLVRALAVAGTAEECAVRLRDLKAKGLDGFIFPLLGGGRVERLRTLRDEVLSGPQIIV